MSTQSEDLRDRIKRYEGVSVYYTHEQQTFVSVVFGRLLDLAENQVALEKRIAELEKRSLADAYHTAAASLEKEGLVGYVEVERDGVFRLEKIR